jgi:hypothetical protein
VPPPLHQPARWRERNPLSRFLCVCLLTLCSLAPSPLAGQDIKLSTWHIVGLWEAEVPGAVLRSRGAVARLAQYASRLDAAVIALQSVDGDSAARPVFGSNYVFHFAVGSGPRSGFAVWRGNSFTTNWDVPLLPASSPTSDSPWLRGADITLNDGRVRLRLLSVEFETGCAETEGGNIGPACERLASNFRQVAAWVRDRERDGDPFVVLGNFNRAMREGRDDLSLALSGSGRLLRANAGFSSPCWLRPELGGRAFEDHIYLEAGSHEWFVPGSLTVLVYDEPWSLMMQVSSRCPVSIRLRLRDPSTNLRDGTGAFQQRRQLEP